MPEPETPVVESTPETPESEPSSFEESADAAQKELASSEAETPVEVTPTVDTPPTEEPVETKVEDTDAEHIAWAKSIKGHFDPDKGFDTERLTKQAFELNKQNQSQAANLKQLQEAFQNPEIAEVFRKVYLQGNQTESPTPDVKPDSEKTNEEILTDFVDKRYDEKVGPLVKQNQFAYDKLLQREYQSTVETMKGEFPNYETISNDVNNAVAQAAADAGVTNETLLEYLAVNGKLVDTFRSAARNILYKPLQEKVTTTEKVEEQVKASLEKQKATQLPGQGSPSSSVDQKINEKMSFDDALEAAEEELKAAAS